MQVGSQSHIYSKLPFWTNLTDEEKRKVSTRMTAAHYKQGQIVRSGDDSECLGLIYVKSGDLRAYLLSPEGREVTLYHIKRNDFCILSATCVLEAISFETQIIAEEDSEVHILPSDVFSSIMQNNIYVERDMYKKATERFSDVVAGVERLVFYNLEQRIASFLLDESADRKTDILDVTHEQIAVNIGSARETVSRTLKSMSKNGLVEIYRGGIKLLHKDGLYKLVL